MKYNSLKLLCNILIVTGMGTLFMVTSSVALFGENDYSYDFGSPWPGDGGPPHPNENEFSYDFGSPWPGDGFKCENCNGD